MNNPQYHQELLEEAKEIYNENKDASYYTSDKIAKMDKLDKFIRESLRRNTHSSKKIFQHALLIY